MRFAGRLPIGPFGARREYAEGEAPPRRGRFKVWPLVLFAIFAAVYYFGNLETVPVTGRSQLVDMSVQDEMQLGLQSYQMLLSRSPTIDSGPEVDLIRSIGKRIAAVTGNDTFEWEFNLFQDSQANAFCLPGGKVGVNTGILPITQNPDGLAVVMGHEIAHAIARHGAERMAYQRLTQFGTIAVGMSVGEMDYQTQRTVLGALGVGSQFGVLLPFSRKHESEADYIGLRYLAEACFNPEEAPRLWERMQKEAGARQPEFMSTHPNPDTRIEQFQEWMPEAVRIYREKCSRAAKDS